MSPLMAVVTTKGGEMVGKHERSGRSVWAILAMTVATVTMLAACSSTAKRVPVPYVIAFKADDAVNPDRHGRPSPIQVSVYELKSTDKFESTDFFTLQSNPQQALGSDLINVERIVLKPGETKKIAHEGSAEGRVVGIVGGYRDLEHSKWRLVLPLPEAQRTNAYKIWQFSPNEEQVAVAVEKGGLVLTGRETPWWPF